MDGEIIDALFGLFDQRIPEDLPGEILGDAPDLLECLIERHSADRDRRVADDPVADIVNVATGRKVHHRIRPPADGPDHLLDLLSHRGGNRGIADIGVDLDQEIPADCHRFELGVIDIRRDDGAAAGDLVADELGSHEVRQRCAEILAVADQRVLGLDPTEILPDRNIFHLRRNDPGSCIGKLRHRPAARGPTRRVPDREGGRQPIAAHETVILRLQQARGIALGIAAGDDPGVARPRQTLLDLDRNRRVGIGPRTVVDSHRRLASRWMQGDLAHRDAQRWMQYPGLVDLGGSRQRVGRDARRFGQGIRHGHRLLKTARWRRGRRRRLAHERHLPYASMTWVRFVGSPRSGALRQPSSDLSAP